MKTYIEFKHKNHVHAIHVPSENVYIYDTGLYVRRYPNKARRQRIDISFRDIIRAVPSHEVTDLFPNDMANINKNELNLSGNGYRIHIEADNKTITKLIGGV